jgi:hypothetical protein
MGGDVGENGEARGYEKYGKVGEDEEEENDETYRKEKEGQRSRSITVVTLLYTVSKLSLCEC